MKVALCCIGRMENRYILEYVEYYKQLGVDKIFIYDNNYDGEEHFEDVIQQYINEGLVDIIDFRNKSICQLEAYQDCYDNHKDEYDWLCFFDIDEYLTFSDEKMNIHNFLSQKIFDNFLMIHINWKVYDDNNLVYYEDKPLRERFRTPKTPFEFNHTYKFPENDHIKSIIRGKMEIKWSSTPHTPLGIKNCCDANGKECDPNSPFNKFNFDSAWLNHYQTKTIQEWMDIKTKRGYPDGNKDYFLKNDAISKFFKVNKKTKEKLNFLKENEYLKNNLDIFICTHKDFEPIVHNDEIYKPINANTINGDVAENGIKGSFYSEILTYSYAAKNIPLKDYVGFCHYRRYFAFLDNVPNMDILFNEHDVIVAKPLKLNRTVRDQYATCHNIEDMEIVEFIVKHKYQEYYDTLETFLNSKVLFPYNMFIMKKEDFLEYIEFINGILDEYVKFVGTDIEGRINNNKEKYLKSFSPNDSVDYQYRIAGYLAERLTNVFILKKFRKIGICPVKVTETKYVTEKRLIKN